MCSNLGKLALVVPVVLAMAFDMVRAQSQCPFVTGGLNYYGTRAVNLNVNGIPPITCSTPPATCPEPHSPYSRLDGSCNNLQHKGWGMPFRRYGRLVPADYGDGYSYPVRAVSGRPLPGARNVSLVMHPDSGKEDVLYTIINMQYGQFLSHDSSLLAGSTLSLRNLTKCCTHDSKMPPHHDDGTQHPYCFPIPVPPNDPLYSAAGVECLEFVRTINDKVAQCKEIGPHSQFNVAEQLTVVTAWLDLSPVYSNSEEEGRSLRSFHRGRLSTVRRNGYEWPIAADNTYDTCDVVKDGARNSSSGSSRDRKNTGSGSSKSTKKQHPSATDDVCYRGGDPRFNQNPGLTVMQILYLREHNRLAAELHRVNPFWSDERLYQVARRINIAIYQHVTYNEWLPLLLGRKNMVKHGLLGNKHTTGRGGGYVNDYDATVDPSPLNEHATAAFRYYHTQVEGTLYLLDEQRNRTGEAIPLSDCFFRPGFVEVGDNYDSFIRCMCTQAQQTTDPRFDAEIRGLLFRGSHKVGQDLRASDIQRSRDHGLASYNDYREWCGMRRARNWTDFLDQFNEVNLRKIRGLYENPDDLEMTVGGAVEKHVNGTLAGPVFLAIMLEQFRRYRQADRYFYENGHDKKICFTPDQLNEIRKATIARVLCDNSNNLKSIQPNAFERISDKNPLKSCTLLPTLDLEAWRDLSAGYEARVQQDLLGEHWET